MINLFIAILNMSLTGAFVIFGVCLARLVMRKSPTIFQLCLWIVVGFRLVFPFTLEGTFSLIPFDFGFVPPYIGDYTYAIRYYSTDVSYIYNLSQLHNSFTWEFWITVATIIWVIGVFFMIIYGIASIVFLRSKLKSAINVENNIYETDTIKTPFVMGFLTPKIYLPVNLSEGERKYIILHEQTHIKRWDHVTKLFSYFILSLHWFNPMVWIAFLVMNKDMEMSCDERVIKQLGGDYENIKDYSSALLSLATGRQSVVASPLSFTNGDVGERVRNVLKIKKQPYLVFVLSMILVVTLSVGFSFDRVSTYESISHVHMESTGIERLNPLCCD